MKFKYSLDNKRYHTLNYYYKEKFKSKVFKISLNAGFGCPNKDKTGKCCIYCYNFSGENDDLSLEEQFNKNKDIMEKKWKNSRYIGYFQAGTNTYAPLDELKEKYELILNMPNVIGLNIATRCDSISDETLDYLEELNKKTFLTIELGLQTIHESTSKLINRGHSLKEFIDCIKKLRNKNINVVAHIINGLPYETKEMMLETTRFLNTIDIQGVKIHMLFIQKNTELAKMYEKEKFHILTMEEYIDIVCDELEELDEHIVINRITGDPEKDLLIEPKWTLRKIDVLNGIDKLLAKRDTFQGCKYKK